jgi:quercetin dioxygenase-like cupin family protein
MAADPPLIVKSASLKPSPTRRQGLQERRLLTFKNSPYQNLVLIEMEDGAEVELHRVETSESMFVLQGAFEVIFPNESQTLEAGDLCYFPPKTWHGLRCTGGPGQFLIVFAPSRYAMEAGE